MNANLRFAVYGKRDAIYIMGGFRKRKFVFFLRLHYTGASDHKPMGANLCQSFPAIKMAALDADKKLAETVRKCPVLYGHKMVTSCQMSALCRSQSAAEGGFH